MHTLGSILSGTRMESITALFEHATEGIIIVDNEGLMIKVNPSANRMFGYTSGELDGLPIEALIPASLTKKHESHRKHYLKSPHARAMGKDFKLRALRKDKSEFPVEISLSYYKNEDKTFVIAFIIDITERVQNEEKIIKMNFDLDLKVKERTSVLQEALIQLESSKEDLKHALKREKELHDLKSRFVTMASHEFRTPLSTILSSISLIAKYTQTEDDEKRQKHVQRIKSAVTNMTLILNDFLSAERLEDGRISAKYSLFSLKELMNETLIEMHGILKPGQQLDYKHEGEVNLELDPQMIKNIFINLISNAIKFSDEGKIITIRTEINNNQTFISIADQGMGIPEEEHEHLFERFFRAKNVTNIQGTGLGLNIVSKYLEAMNGNIQFKSELNKGTIFEITIPIQNAR
ncbi:MAG: PAS domain-containing sensor histidine kinase [Bacteroidia bacterium]|nr:PAS domain-containing sensor histidine kinase [Bacteroidia bacterium]